MQNSNPHLHRDRLHELPTNEHGVWEEMNQLWSVLAWGHGTIKRCPPALCSDMAGQRGWVACVCVGLHVRVCLDLLFPDRDCAPACDCLCESAGELSLVRVRVNSSYGQMPRLLLSRQRAATKTDRKQGWAGIQHPGLSKNSNFDALVMKKSAAQYVHL